MSSNLPSLNSDVLLQIFDLNADMFRDDDTLSTARITSQVCRHWRSLMLETPSLWAKLIDMDQISYRWKSWRHELIRRSGDAPLWIQARLFWSHRAHEEERGPYDKDIQHFFDEVITKNWHRIEKIVLSHHSAFELTESMLRFPAPVLKHIEAPAPFEASLPLFSNYAPMLRNIYLESDLVDQRASWLCHLLSIKLDKTYSLSDALAVLSPTRHLQRLEIMDIATGNQDSSLPIVSLSRLQDLTYGVHDSNAGVTLLDYMSIPIGCSLSIRFKSFDNNVGYIYQKQFILSIIDHFIRHAERFLESQTFSGVHLDYSQNNYIFWRCLADFAVQPLLEILIPLNGDSDATILEYFLKRIPPLNRTSPTYFSIKAYCQLISHFGTFFSRLSSVGRIYTDLRTLLNLVDLQNAVNSDAESTSSIFPMLKVITLVGYNRIPQKISFISELLQAGISITTFDMSLIRRFDTPPEFQALEKVNGLKILYKLKGRDEVIEYQCGAMTNNLH